MGILFIFSFVSPLLLGAASWTSLTFVILSAESRAISFAFKWNDWLLLVSDYYCKTCLFLSLHVYRNFHLAHRFINDYHASLRLMMENFSHLSFYFLVIILTHNFKERSASASFTFSGSWVIRYTIHHISLTNSIENTGREIVYRSIASMHYDYEWVFLVRSEYKLCY